MYKMVTLTNDQGHTRTGRVMVIASNDRLQAALETAAEAALAAYCGPGGERVVHMRDVGRGGGRRPNDAPPPGRDADGGGAPDDEQDHAGGDEQETAI